jgi:hypothetical protein
MISFKVLNPHIFLNKTSRNISSAAIRPGYLSDTNMHNPARRIFILYTLSNINFNRHNLVGAIAFSCMSSLYFVCVTEV